MAMENYPDSTEPAYFSLTEEVFTGLFEKYWYKLFCVAFSRIDDKEACEGMVQDIFLRLWERKEQLAIRNIEHYLFKSIRYAVTDHIRHSITLERHLDLYRQYLAIDHSPYSEEQVEQFLNDGVNALPEQSSTIFRLNYYDKMKNPEIARHLNVSEKVIEYHLTKSIKALRVFLRNVAFLFF